MAGELRKRLERCRRFGDVTRNGVVFDYALAGPSAPTSSCFVNRGTQTRTLRKARQTCATPTMSSVSLSLRSHKQNLTPRFCPTESDTGALRSARLVPFIRSSPSTLPNGRSTYVAGDFPRLQHLDIGRRLALNDDVLQMESQEQFIVRERFWQTVPADLQCFHEAAMWYVLRLHGNGRARS
jgi:hypothetical protein